MREWCSGLLKDEVEGPLAEKHQIEVCKKQRCGASVKRRS